MASTITAIVDSQIRLDGTKLPDEAIKSITRKLTIDNPAKQKAEMAGVPGWERMADVIPLWEADGDELVMPRGFAFDLADILDKNEVEVDWDDQRTMPRGFRLGQPIDLYDHQKKIVETIMELEMGIIKSPTGSGKTVAMLELFRLIAGSGIIVVNTKEIASQWISRCRKFLGPDYPVSLVGDGKFEIAQNGLTVAIQATLWSRREELEEEGFFERFSAAGLDECHHATAATYNDIFARFTAKYRFGASATPEKTGEFKLAQMVIGPIVVEVTEAEIEGNITKPIVEVIETRFGTNVGKKKKANVMASRRDYQLIIKNLIKDQDRIQLVAKEIIVNHFENANLVLSKRIAHLEAIYDALVVGGFPEDRLLAMVGNHSLEERDEAIAMTEEGNCVLLTTLADEALDAPRLDRCHLAFPTKNPELVLQQIGRIRRKHPAKLDSIVIDYRDKQVRMLDSQYMTRRHSVYDKRGFKVVKRSLTDPHARVQ